MIKYIKIFAVTGLFLFVCESYGQTRDEIIIRGMDHMYHMRMDSAKFDFDWVVSMNSKDPAGYFFLALLEWWKISVNKEDESNDENFYRAVERVEDVADKVLDKNSQDPNALFYKGAAVGYRGLVKAIRNSWLNAAEDGKEALDLFGDVHELQPANKDVLFGTGVYNYFAEYVPDRYPFLKPLMILFPDGDKTRGLLQIKETAINSTFAKTEAKLILAYLYLRYEKNYLEAELYSKSLLDQYPENSLFARYLYNSYVGLSKYNDAIEGWKKVIEASDNKQYGYTNPFLKREAYYYLGFSNMNLGNNEEAKNYFIKAEELSNQIDKEGSMIKAFNLLWLGVTYRNLMDTGKAREYFDKVLNMENFGDSHKQAEQFKNQL